MDIPGPDGKSHHIEFVDKADVPKILFNIFVGQPDCRRINFDDHAHEHHHHDGDHTLGDCQQLIEHIIEEVWPTFDEHGCGGLHKEQAMDFFQTVLELHEKILSEQLGRPYREVEYADIERAQVACDIDYNGKITKHGISEWVKTFIKDNNHVNDDNTEVVKRISQRQQK